MKYKMNDVAILMIVKFDSIDRLENTLVVLNHILNNFDTNLYVWEVGKFNNQILRTLVKEGVNYEFHEDYDPILHRTKYLNDMVKSVKEDYVAIWDADVIVPVEQVVQTVEALREGCEFVYPYKGYFYDTSFAIRNAFYKTRDMALLSEYHSFMKEMYSPNPVGGVFFANRLSYIDSGLEQELFYGWGAEDGERYHRWKEQNRKVDRIEGVIYHLSHSRGINSYISTDYDSIIKRRLLFSTKKGINR